jgi:hypothetical protein
VVAALERAGWWVGAPVVTPEVEGRIFDDHHQQQQQQEHTQVTL